MVTRIAPEELEVEPVGFGPEIGLLTGVPALGDVVKNPGENHVRHSGQRDRVAISPQKISGVVYESRPAPVGLPANALQ
jgi:hypothetical protein